MNKLNKKWLFAASIISLSISSAYALNASTPVSESTKPVTEQLVNTMTKLFGTHDGYRSNHAKGIVVLGDFTPAKTAASLTKAAHLQTTKSPVIVRFSDATGVPTIPDADGNAFPKGSSFALPCQIAQQQTLSVFQPMAFLLQRQKTF